MSTLSTSKRNAAATPRAGRLKKAASDYHHGQLREALLAMARRHLAAGREDIGLRELAAAYHSYYDAERILVDDEGVKQARLALVAATAQVLHNGLAVLGVSAPQKM